MTEIGDFTGNEYYVNREASWFSFLERVLSEGADPRYTDKERARFLAIVSGSLDEFFAVRLATLLRQKKEFPDLKDICGLTAEEQIGLVLKRAGEFLAEADRVASSYVNHDSSRDIMLTSRLFEDRLIPFNPAAIKSESVNIILKSKDGCARYLLPLNSPSKRIVFSGDGIGVGRQAHLLEDILRNSDGILPDFIDTSEISVFKAVRDRDEIYDWDPTPAGMEMWLKDLKNAPFVCCILKDTASSDTVDYLAKKLKLTKDSIFKSSFVDLGFVSELFRKESPEDTEKTLAVKGSVFRKTGAFSYISERDHICLLPYESFDCVTDLLREAASDPDVISIRQTLYRTGKDSKVTDLLCKAAKNGKDVTVLMELRARYDEERNLENTKKLTAAGAKVLFGRAGIKTHCKLLLIERKEAGGIRRYAHISTGNYNEFTAKSYTDVGLFTASPGICDDVFSLFEYASGKDEFHDLYSLSASPRGLKEEFLRLIDRERTFAEAGKSAKISAKVNSLCDRDFIEALYRAAASGVKVTLIVRGICCLKLDDPRLKDNLTVYSVVGKQLEHSRIFR
ncbi:MAG: hypothetical protein ILP13_08605, partial [Lachnospiraceae bacterium]|nr:hypothetical protein [Lachnospiraceae bacterium]